uniref:Uncharacterized protein n=1 Tax=Sphaerodactylus townsendi TaxID=933632 RepID=A0ACB8EHC1_9SAUR
MCNHNLETSLALPTDLDKYLLSLGSRSHTENNFEAQTCKQLQKQSELEELFQNLSLGQKLLCRRTFSLIMPSAQLFLLLFFLAFTSVCVNLGQPFTEDGENEEKSHLDDIFQRAENIILRSILKKAEDNEEDTNNEPSASQLNWISKRQHPGKRSLNSLDKRQHPGRREDTSDDSYGETLKRQHPGKREEDDEFERYVELQKRQHPGKRALWDPYSEIPSNQLAYSNELTKRQHPGKRYLAYSKRQHPGKRSWEDELDSSEQDLEKRQHPGKRYLGLESPDYPAPCDPQDSINCSQSGLLELLDSINKGQGEEKRQHPGRRSSWDGAVEAEE